MYRSYRLAAQRASCCFPTTLIFIHGKMKRFGSRDRMLTQSQGRYGSILWEHPERTITGLKIMKIYAQEAVTSIRRSVRLKNDVLHFREGSCVYCFRKRSSPGSSSSRQSVLHLKQLALLVHCMGPRSLIAMAQAEHNRFCEGGGDGAAMTMIVRMAKRRPKMPRLLRML